jgi:hypothetical protein
MSNHHVRTGPLATTKKYGGGKMFVEKPQILEDLLTTGIEEHPRRYRTERLNPHSLHGGASTSSSYRNNSNSPHRRSDEDSINDKTIPLTDLINLRKDENISITAAQAAREKKDRMFPVLLERVNESSRFLESIEKEMILVSEAKNNKMRRQYEDWNTNVHGKIQVSSF